MGFEFTLFGKVKLIIQILDFDFTDGDVAVGITVSWK